MKDIVLDYLNYGLVPIPCQEKQPLVAWKEYQEDCSPTRATVEEWHDKYPGCNWALVIRDFVVFDLDNPDNDDWKFEIGELERTALLVCQ